MPNSSGFYHLGIAPSILSVLDKLGFVTPTPIQERTIPAGLEGKDLIGIAQTGTGKTLAFGIPMIQGALSGRQGFIIVPTRELALQVEEALMRVGGPLRIRAISLIGGGAMHAQIKALSNKPNIIIGTPGRIVDHLERRTLSLAHVKMLVLDEADRMLDMGFAPQLKRILALLPKERHTMLFSATMPQDIVRIAESYMKTPTQIEVAPQGTTADKVTQELFFVEKNDKPRLLEKILYEYKGSVLIFMRMKFAAKRLAMSIKHLGHTVAEIHSNRSLGQRKEALEGFKNGRYRVLVATDIAARGIDVKGIELVINYDLPQSPGDYVHRIGRTGRAGGVGHAISFATPAERGDVKSIERLIRATLPQSKVENLPPAREIPRSTSGFSGGRPQFGGRGRSRPGSGPRGFGARRPWRR